MRNISNDLNSKVTNSNFSNLDLAQVARLYQILDTPEKRKLVDILHYNPTKPNKLDFDSIVEQHFSGNYGLITCDLYELLDKKVIEQEIERKKIGKGFLETKQYFINKEWNSVFKLMMEFEKKQIFNQEILKKTRE